MNTTKRKTTQKLLIVAAVILVAAGAWVALAWARGHVGAPAEQRYDMDQTRIMGTLAGVDTSARTIQLRLEDGSRRTLHYNDKTFFLVDGKMASPATLRRGEQAAVVPTDREDTAEYVAQGAWRCPPGGKLPLSKDPTTLLCPPK